MITKMFYVEMKLFKTVNDFMFFFLRNDKTSHLGAERVKNICEKYSDYSKIILKTCICQYPV